MKKSDKKNHYLAYDLGATNGRAIAGYISDDKRLKLKEIHRFPTGMININGSWQWNIFSFFQEMKTALKKCIDLQDLNLKTIAIDTWGVDFGFVTKNSEILGLPYAYRDSRTEGIPQEFFKLLTKKKIYELTGIEFMQINSLYQLYAMVKNGSPFLKTARSLLFIPDMLNFLFTGVKTTEFSFATTSQLYNPESKKWEKTLFDALGLSTKMMCEIIQPGTSIGYIHNFIQKETNAGNIKVVSTVSHDTGAAIASIPAKGKNWAYISSGTWSVLGVETERPVITDQSFELDFTNEGGVNGRFCLQKNLTGFWILEQFKKSRKELVDYNYERLMGKALNAESFISFLNVDDKLFMNPSDMDSAIKNYLIESHQAVPEAASQIVRLILENMAFKYRQTMDQLKLIYPHPIEKIHIIGGGAQNYLLNQFTANATGLTVIAGPYEGTAIGNIIVQAIADNTIKDIGQARSIVADSVKLKIFKPQDCKEWNNAFKKYQEKIL